MTNKPPTLQEFAEMVDAMRGSQKLYFRTRDQFTLTNAKQREREVDKALAKILGVNQGRQPLSGQRSLFDE